MKYNRIILFASAALIAAACAKQTQYPEFSYGPADASEGKVEVFFPTTYAYEELDPEISSYDIKVSRTDNAAALSVNLTVSDPSGVFSVPKTVEFAAGESDAVLTVDISKLELEKQYDLIVSISSDNYYAYKATEASSKIAFHLSALKQKWDDAGTCTFYDGTWFDDIQVVENIPIQNHSGTDDYRIVAPYAAIPDEDPFPAVNILFSLNEKGEVTFAQGASDFFGIGYNFYWDTANYSSYCYVAPSATEGGAYLFEVHFLLNQGTSLYTGGYFAFEWDGYPAEKYAKSDEQEGAE